MGSFADNLRKIRQEKNMSQEEFAKVLNTSKQNISRYESGAVSPKISTAAKFAEIPHVSLSELNGDDNVATVHTIHPQKVINQQAEIAWHSHKRKQLIDLLSRIPDDKADLVVRIVESILADGQK